MYFSMNRSELVSEICEVAGQTLVPKFGFHYLADIKKIIFFIATIELYSNFLPPALSINLPHSKVQPLRACKIQLSCKLRILCSVKMMQGSFSFRLFVESNHITQTKKTQTK